MKRRSILIILSLLAALILISTQALAAPKGPGGNKGAKENFRGTLIAVDASSITLQVADSGEQLTIAVNASTKIKIPGIKNATTADLAVNGEAVVQAVRAEDGSLTALQIHGMPAKGNKGHRVGRVTELSASSITIQNGDSQTYTFVVTPETQILYKTDKAVLEVGAIVTIVAPRAAAEPITATAIVVHTSGNGEDDGDEMDDNGQGSNINKAHRAGLITELSETSLTIQDEDGAGYTFAVTPTTKIILKKHAELAVGAKVNIIASVDENGNATATQIMVHAIEDESGD